MQLRKRVAGLIIFEIIKIIAQVFYFAGLTALIPLVPLLLSPQQLIGARYAFGVAFGFIFVGFLVVYWFSASKKIAFRSLGLMTLIPGLLAVLFSYIGPRRMAIVLRWFGEASPLLETWIESYVPKAWLLAGIYIILGTALVWLSEKVKY
jgi:hypothetical protein